MCIRDSFLDCRHIVSLRGRREDRGGVNGARVAMVVAGDLRVAEVAAAGEPDRHGSGVRAARVGGWGSGRPHVGDTPVSYTQDVYKRQVEGKEASFDDREMTSVKTSKAVLVAVVTDVVYQPE